MQDKANKSALVDDLLDGGAQICLELYGAATRADLRRLYHQRDQLPIFQLDNSGRFYALRSRLRAHLEAKSAEKEARIAAAAAKAAGKAGGKTVTKATPPPPRRPRGRPRQAVA
jgi:hypothetical protein